MKKTLSIFGIALLLPFVCAAQTVLNVADGEMTSGTEIIDKYGKFRGYNPMSYSLGGYEFEFSNPNVNFPPDIKEQDGQKYVYLYIWPSNNAVPTVKITAPEGELMTQVVFKSLTTGMSTTEFKDVSSGWLETAEKASQFIWHALTPVRSFSFSAINSGSATFRLYEIEVTTQKGGGTTPSLPDEIVYSPAEGENVAECSVVTVTFPELIEVDNSLVYLYRPSLPAVACDAVAKGNVLEVTPSEPLTDGEYTLRINSGIWLLKSDKYADPISVNFSVGAPKIPTPVVKPAPGELTDGSELNKVTLTFPEGTGVHINGEDYYVCTLCPIVNGAPGISVTSYTMSALENVLTLKAQSRITSLDPGQYRVSISDKAFNAGAGVSPLLEYDYTVPEQSSSVAGLEIEMRADVWSAAGCLVLRDASESEIRRLPKGIYIVGGRKVAL